MIIAASCSCSSGETFKLGPSKLEPKSPSLKWGPLRRTLLLLVAVVEVAVVVTVVAAGLVVVVVAAVAVARAVTCFSK